MLHSYQRLNYIHHNSIYHVAAVLLVGVPSVVVAVVDALEDECKHAVN